MVLVFEPMRGGILLQEETTEDGFIPSQYVRAISLIVLKALDFIHTKCHIIHTDIKVQNVLFSIESQNVIDEFVKAETQSPSPRKVVGDREIYPTRMFHVWTKIAMPKLADFGFAVSGDESHHHMIQPDVLRAPEVILGADWSYSVDVWNFGTFIWELVAKLCLFNARDPQTQEYSPAVHLAEMIALLGPPPKELLRRGRNSSLFFTTDGAFRFPNLIPSQFGLESAETLRRDEDEGEFFLFMRKTLKWLPEDRETADELLEDPWVNKYYRR